MIQKNKRGKIRSIKKKKILKKCVSSNSYKKINFLKTKEREMETHHTGHRATANKNLSVEP